MLIGVNRIFHGLQDIELDIFQWIGLLSLLGKIHPASPGSSFASILMIESFGPRNHGLFFN